MFGRYYHFVNRLLQSVITAPGMTTPATRQAIETFGAAYSRQSHPQPDDLPSGVTAYAEKVVGRAYTITDDDIASLKQLGYSEDAIFEITVSAALGAGMGRLQQGLNALAGEI